MQNEKENLPLPGMVLLLMVIINIVVLQKGLLQNEAWYKALPVTLAALLLSALYYRKS